MASQAQTLTQLNSARDIVLRDHALYPQVVPGIIAVIAPGAALELRRWGADFLAETFASQAVTAEEKQQMALVVLDTLRGYLNRKETFGEDEDANVVKSTVQCAASVYPFVFRHVANNPADGEAWEKLAGIKSSILRRMDTASPGVRICCIKFVANVVLTQTPGVISDPRRPEVNEISLALVSRNHSVLVAANLEAEASGLLDRLLGVLQDNLTDALIVTATLNALSSTVQRRASVTAKVIQTVLAYNPLALAGRPLSGKDKVQTRSMTRTTIVFLTNFLKRTPNTPFAARIQQRAEILRHSLVEATTDTQNNKRPAPDDGSNADDDVKRLRMDPGAMNYAVQPSGNRFPPLPSPPVSLAQLFTLTTDLPTTQFHVERLQIKDVTQLIPAIINSVPSNRIDEAVNAVRGRWLSMEQQATAKPTETDKTGATEDDDDDYDPSLGFDGEPVQPVDALQPFQVGGPVQSFAIGPFNLPTPPPLTEADRDEYSRTALTRMFGTLIHLDQEAKTKRKPPSDTAKGFNRIAAASATAGHDREGWITLLTRLATRTSVKLAVASDTVKREDDSAAVTKKRPPTDLPRSIRDALFAYVMENFRTRIDVAITWLNEEWYASRLAQQQRVDEGEDLDPDDLPQYWQHVLRLLDAMVPYLDVKDAKTLIRFLSEIPAINRSVLQRLKDVADDPERVQISTNSLLYLIMLRPPVRQMAIDCAEELYRDNQHARTAAKKILVKWRPASLGQEAAPEVKTEA